MAATNVDDLVAFLLDEIALWGEEGATVAKFFDVVHEFYRTTSESHFRAGNRSTGPADATSTPANLADIGSQPNLTRATELYSQNQRPSVVIDDLLRAKIWQWITAHPDVFVGEGKSRNKLTLEAVEKLDDDAVKEHEKNLASQPMTMDSNPAQHGGATGPTAKKLHSATSAEVKNLTKIRVTKERVWFTLTGHSVDPKKCPRSEFACLVYIAASRERGILQTDLVRLVRQDSRSLPRRTDFLHAKGYIVKKPSIGTVGLKGIRTSILIHHKFAERAGASQTSTSQADGSGLNAQLSARNWPEKNGINRSFDLDGFTREFFKVVRGFDLVAKTDLKAKLNIVGNRLMARVLNHVIRRFEEHGFLKRVRAASQFADLELGVYHECIKLVRMPDTTEMRVVWGPTANQKRFDPDDGLGNEGSGSDDDGSDGPGGTRRQESDPAMAINDPSGAESASLREVEMQIPQWTPKQSWGNMFYEIISRSGTQGLSTMDIKAQCLGLFAERPIIMLLERYSEDFRLSQPVHLHNYGIVRDLAQDKKAAHFQFFTYANYEQLVSCGKAAWKEAAPMEPTARKRKLGEMQSIPAHTREAALDRLGFPYLEARDFFTVRGVESVQDIVSTARPEYYSMSGHDLAIMTRKDGTLELEVVYEGPLGHDKNGLRKIADDPNKIKKPLGRPRKDAGGDKSQRAGTRASQQEQAKERALGKIKAREGEKKRKVAMPLEVGREADEAGPELEDTAEKDLTVSVDLPRQSTRTRQKTIQAIESRDTASERSIAQVAQEVGAETHNGDVVNPEERAMKVPKERAPTKPRAKKGPSAAVGAGSLLFRRKKIILDLVDSYGGVFPGDRELWFPYTATWLKENPGAGSPDQRTINAVQKALIDSEQLRFVMFSFTNPKGALQKKRILTHPGIPADSPLVLDLQSRMKRVNGDFFCLENYEVEDKSIASQLTARKAAGGKKSKPKLAEYSEEIVTLEHAVTVAAYPGHDQPYRPRVRRGAVVLPTEQSGGVRQHAKQQRWKLTAEERIRAATKIQQMVEARPWMHRSIQGPIRVARLHDLSTNPDGSLLSSHFGGRRPLEMTRTGDGVREGLREMYCHQAALNAPRQLLHRATGTFVTLFSPAQYQMGYNVARHAWGVEDMIEAAGNEPMWEKRAYIKSGLYSKRNIFTIHPDMTNAEWSVSQMGHHAALGAPTQEFLTCSGTFGTMFRPGDYRIGYRNPAHSNYLGGRHRVVRRPPYRDSVADPLQWILKQNRLGRVMDHSQEYDPETSRFFYEVNRVLNWERRPETKRNWPEQLMRGRFINHTMSWQELGEDLSLVRIKWDDARSLHCTIETPPEDEPSDPSTPQLAKRRKRCLELDEMQLADEALSERAVPESESVYAFKTRSLCATQKVHSHIPIHSRRDPSESEAEASPTRVNGGRRKILRRRRGFVSTQASSFTPDDDRRLLVTIAVVRCLVGGIGRLIDFVLVNKCLPHWVMPVIQRRWYNVRQKHAMYLEKIIVDFREAYLEAYEAGTVPYMDYDRLPEYDWNWLVDWTLNMLDAPSSYDMPTLLQDRSQTEDVYNLRPKSGSASYWRDDYYTSLVPYFRRYQVARENALTIPLHPTCSSTARSTTTSLPELAVARSWIRANIITPEDGYSPYLAKAKLLSLNNDLLDSALSSLRVDKVLTFAHRNRIVPGRNFDVTENFLHALKTHLCETHLMGAVASKARLDSAFQMANGGVVDFRLFSAEEADVICVLNLVANQRVVVSPRDVPASEFGMLDGHYRTKILDKRKLHFELDLRATERYVYGNPLLPLPAPECSHLNEDQAAIPAWYDIHGRLMEGMWAKCVTAILSMVERRAGIGSAAIMTALKPALEEWEIERLAGWLERVGALVRVGKGDGIASGWQLCEWWWLVLEGIEAVDSTG